MKIHMWNVQIGVRMSSLFGWLVADGWCWFVLREEYSWLVVGGWFVMREKYCWLMADKPSEQGGGRYDFCKICIPSAPV
jgi:hypothetical protein